MRRIRFALGGALCAAALATVGLLAHGERETACACGGPAFYDIDAPLQAPDRWLNDITLVDEFDQQPRDELRFLAPFHEGDTLRTAALWDWAYHGNVVPQDSLVESMVQPLDAALKAGDIARAERVARAIVDSVLDVPSVIADERQNAMRRAVELIELAPSLQGVPAALVGAVLATGINPYTPATVSATLPPALAAANEVRRLERPQVAAFVRAHPTHLRAASLRWVVLQQRLHDEIPNGWPEDIRKQVKPATWRSLDSAHVRWLADYPSHPLADLVRLSRVRVAYYEGDSTRAWRLAFAPWPRHPHRVLAEARVLAVRGMVAEPPAPAANDPRVRSAMLTVREPSRTEWDALWRVAEDSIARPWAVNLEERLLERAARSAMSGNPLPSRFPARPAQRTSLWGELRLVALLAAGDTTRAEAQATALGTDDELARRARVRLAIARRQWGRAAHETGVSFDVRHYVTRVLAPDSALVPIVLDARADTGLRADAAKGIAARALARGDWTRGAQVLAQAGVPTALVTRWRRGATLAADTSLAGRLAYARWLASQRGQLFTEVDNAWFRSLAWRINALRDTTVRDSSRTGHAIAPDVEIAAITAHLRQTTEAYLALQAYAAWLTRTEPRAAAMRTERRAVAREADRAYNWLVNWDSNNSSFWAELLERSEEARVVRRAGR